MTLMNRIMHFNDHRRNKHQTRILKQSQTTQMQKNLFQRKIKYYIKVNQL